MAFWRKSCGGLPCLARLPPADRALLVVAGRQAGAVYVDMTATALGQPN